MQNDATEVEALFVFEPTVSATVSQLNLLVRRHMSLTLATPFSSELHAISVL
jgi:hypothetical protein